LGGVVIRKKQGKNSKGGELRGKKSYIGNSPKGLGTKKRKIENLNVFEGRRL